MTVRVYHGIIIHNMDNLKLNKSCETKTESENPYSSLVSLEDRLKVIANLIVDRVIEDQQSGTLRLRPDNK